MSNDGRQSSRFSVMSAPDPALDAARSYRFDRGGELVESFNQLLRLDNVTGDVPALEKNAAELVRRFEERGAAMQAVALPGAAPVVIGRLRASGERLRTIGMYAHYDGQPVDPAAWDGDPFEPVIRDGRIYARGAADDKAPMAAVLGAIDALQAGGIDRHTELVFLFEGEEESGSPNLPAYMELVRDELAADLWLICDGPVHPTGRPQVVFGVRGYCGFELTVFGPERELHSGHFGNWVPNPAHDLAVLLASCKDEKGRVLVEGFYDSATPVSPADLDAISALPNVEDQYQADLGFGAPEPGGGSYVEQLLRPSFNIRGLHAAAVGDDARNVIPSRASASVDIRLVAGNDPAAMLDLVAAHLTAQGYLVLDRDPTADERRSLRHIARFDREIGYPAARIPVDLDEAAPIVSAAGATGRGGVVRLPTFGGSVPLHHFNEILGSPVVMLPIANYDNNQHAANENLKIDNLWYGIDLWAVLLGGEIDSGR
jgi:acetylornithine deacetylase/succinyl-diaminopimelate desuccinylase-like protein